MTPSRSQRPSLVLGSGASLADGGRLADATTRPLRACGLLELGLSVVAPVITVQVATRAWQADGLNTLGAAGGCALGRHPAPIMACHA